MDISGIITRSFNDVLSNPKALVPSLIVFAAIVAALLSVIALTGLYSGGTPFRGLWGQPVRSSMMNASATQTAFHSLLGTFTGTVRGVAVMLGAFMLVSFIISVLLNGIIVAIGDQLFNRKGVSLSDAFALAKSRFFSMFGAGIISAAAVLLVIGVAALGIVGAFLALGPLAAIIIASFIAIAVVVALLFTAIFFFQVNTVVVLERMGAFESIRRSFGIASSNKLNIFAVLVLAGIITGAVELVGVFLAMIPVLGWILDLLVILFVSVWFGVMPVYFYRNLAAKTAGRRGGKARSRKNARV